MATSSIDSVVILNLASVTSSLIIEMLSLRYFGSANVNFILHPITYFFLKRENLLEYINLWDYLVHIKLVNIKQLINLLD